MIKINIMTSNSEHWEKTIELAECCSWKAGPFLAKAMRDDRFNSFERVISVCIDDEVVGFCSFLEKDELPEEYNFTPFIGYMFVDEKYRGNRLSQRMIEAACEYAVKVGFEKVYIMSGEQGLYERYGFKKLGEYETVFGTKDSLFVRELQYKK